MNNYIVEDLSMNIIVNRQFNMSFDTNYFTVFFYKTLGFLTA